MELIEAQKIANNLMAKHGIIEKGWRFEFDNAKRRFGCCNYTHKKITLSRHLVSLNEESQVKDTILHEIAHALTPGHHHDYIWRMKAVEIGCNGERCYKSKNVTTPESKYVAICVGCGVTHKKHKKTTRSYSCQHCSGGRYNPSFKLDYRLNMRIAA